MSLVNVFTDQIRPDRLRRYEACIAELAAAARDQNDPWRWTAHQVGVGDGARMYYVSRHPDHADVERSGDPPTLFSRLLGERQGLQLLDETSECLVHNQRTLGIERPDLSYPQQAPEGIAPMASIALIHARAGHQEALEDMLRQLAEAIPKAGEEARIDCTQSLTGDMLSYWIVRPLESLADLDHQPIGRDLLIAAYGQNDGARIFRTGLAAADRVDREITRLRQDLSNPPR